MAHRFIRAAALAFLLVAFSASPSIASAQNPGQAKGHSNKAYIVQLSEEPVVAYRGGIPGYRATRPSKGQKIDPTSPHVINYAAFLESRHDAALSAVGGGKKLYSYRFSFNGFAAELTEEQVAKMLQVPGVVAINKDEARALDTSSTPAFLGLNAPGGLWDQLGGVGSAGENVIIGIVDGGIWPESLSFSDRTGTNGNASKDGKLSYQQIPGWHGRCVPGDAFNASNCNQKLIGAQFFNAGWGGDAGIARSSPGSSSRRATSAATARTRPPRRAETTTSRRPAWPRCSAASVASPRAPGSRPTRSAGQTPTGGSCFSSDSVAAIDQAVADGVDVINFSISGVDDQLPRLGRDRLPLRRRRGRVRRGFGGQQRPDHEHRGPSGPVAHDGRSGHAQPKWQEAR